MPRAQRIYGGQDADKYEYPWQVLLHQSTSASNTYCGGTLISSQWILTAFHCINTPNSIAVYMKATNLHQDGLIAMGTSTRKAMPNSGFPFFDIGLIKAGSYLGNFFTYYLYPACLPGPDYPYKPDTKVMASGWGQTASEMDRGVPVASPQLQELEMELRHQVKSVLKIKMQLRLTTRCFRVIVLLLCR